MYGSHVTIYKEQKSYLVLLSWHSSVVTVKKVVFVDTEGKLLTGYSSNTSPQRYQQISVWSPAHLTLILLMWRIG